jgi:hypothetical protein
MASAQQQQTAYVISIQEATSWIGMQLYNADGVFLGNIVSTFRSEYCSWSYAAVRTTLDSVRGPLNGPFTISNYDTNTYPRYSDKAILGNKAIYTKTLPFVGQCGSYPIFEEPSTILLMAGPGPNQYGYVISNEEATSWIGMQLYNADGVFLGNIVSTYPSEYCHMSYPAVRTRLDSVRGPLNSPFTIRNYNTNTYPGYSDKAIKAPSVGGYRRRKNKKTRRRPYKIENKTRKN